MFIDKKIKVLIGADKINKFLLNCFIYNFNCFDRNL